MGSRHAVMLSGAFLFCAGATQATLAEQTQPPTASLSPVKVTVVDTASASTQDIAPANVIGVEDRTGPSAVIFGADSRRPVDPGATVLNVGYRSTSERCRNGIVPTETIKQMITVEARAQGLDPKLALAVSQQESGFGTNNNSDAGARGPMQLIPSTAAQYHVSDICDAVQNIQGGIAFLKDLNTEFGGNVFLMLAAYNAGQDRVYRARGVPAIAETVNYVASVANAYYGYDNALQRGKGVPGRSGRVVPISDTRGATSTGQGSLSSNQPLTQKPANSWIGGTVLYVNNTGGGN
jgi:soluble lytic murein transglycosylase-like protein